MLDGLGRIFTIACKGVIKISNLVETDRNASSGCPPFLLTQKRVLAGTSDWVSTKVLASANIGYDGRVHRWQLLNVKMFNCTSTVRFGRQLQCMGLYVV
jgi:hypothetical protein